MPTVHITLAVGRSDAQKAQLHQAVTHAITNTLGNAPQGVKIILHEVPAINISVAGVPKGQPVTSG